MHLFKNHEQWKPILGLEGLNEISNQGRVRSLDHAIVNNGTIQQINGKVLKTRTHHKTGYIMVTLRYPQKKTVTIHRLVATAFVPNPFGEPTVNHINGIKSDNRADNLEWVSYKVNNQHAYDIGAKSRIHAGQFLPGTSGRQGEPRRRPSVFNTRTSNMANTAQER